MQPISMIGKTFTSSDWAERAFCKICGSNLFSQLNHGNNPIEQVGLSGDGPYFSLTHQIFTEEKPDHVCFANLTHDISGKKVFAQALADKP